MSEPAVTVERLSKKYLLGEVHTDLLSERLSQLFRGRSSGNAAARTEFWALRDVGFEVREGEVLGIIGRNGAGKSTLLKILSRLTAPTAGRAVVRGRLASLLEIGTGFHPELTGRENIYLNGTILGMRRREIDRKFADIVAFAEVEKFLDTPVKRYSSGMYVRLAFAVAAHLEPDVLLVDEVLAVGDREFQEKCLGRLKSISEQEGRTVLFVSHNLDAVSRICTAGLYLRNGEVVYRGGVAGAIDAYLGIDKVAERAADLGERTERWGSGEVRITSFELLDASGVPAVAMSSGDDYEIVMTYTVSDAGSDLAGAVGSLALADARGVTVLLVSSEFSGESLGLSRDGGRIRCRIRDLNLAPGMYSLTLYLGNKLRETFDCLNDVEKIAVVGGDFFGSGHPGHPDACRVLTRSSWSAE
jgi:lipopolysaccharide transport system ATP-binding protein